MCKYFAIFSTLICIGCSHSIIGTYQHRICKVGPNCFHLSLFKDSTFQYKYYQDILGSGIITGRFEFTKDTLHLITVADTMHPIVKTFASNDKELKVHVFQITKNDTIPAYGSIIINGNIKLDLNDGVAKFAPIFLQAIKLNILEIDPMRDTIFQMNTFDNNIYIYSFVPPAFDSWVSRNYLKKGNKLYPLHYEPEMVLFGKETYYKKQSTK